MNLAERLAQKHSSFTGGGSKPRFATDRNIAEAVDEALEEAAKVKLINPGEIVECSDAPGFMEGARWAETRFRERIRGMKSGS